MRSSGTLLTLRGASKSNLPGLGLAEEAHIKISFLRIVSKVCSKHSPKSKSKACLRASPSPALFSSLKFQGFGGPFTVPKSSSRHLNFYAFPLLDPCLSGVFCSEMLPPFLGSTRFSFLNPPWPHHCVQCQLFLFTEHIKQDPVSFSLRNVYLQSLLDYWGKQLIQSRNLY